MAADRVFIDTSILMAASVKAHPIHAVVTAGSTVRAVLYQDIADTS